MKKFCGLILVGLCLLLASGAFALEVPKATQMRVYDLTGILSDEQLFELDNQLVLYDEKTSNQIAVLIIPSLEDEVLEEYSLKVAETWGIGQAGKDNGVLILITKQERKIRIEVGYGLEGALTDLESGRIIDYVMTPAFKESDFFGGISGAIDKIQVAIEGEFTVSEEDMQRAKKSGEEDSTFEVLLIVYFLLLLATGLASLLHEIVGGIAGLIGGPVVTGMFFTPSVPVIVIIAVVWFILGFFSKHIIPVLLEVGLHVGAGGGGSSSSGSGFGGGGFGGGGASGGW